MSDFVSNEDHGIEVKRVQYVLISLLSICTLRRVPAIETFRNEIYVHLMKLKISD
ncbi:hypothetical protein PVOR_11830 [Paenibacillus vortex V453]|jgi:hypothetical protein|uniref:Uncharacterized protein n=1 Tax=Paenibacillus vortex V453 TaxID=715225 RepID=A0A2R9SWB1_9BACL|nr:MULTISPECIES: hypothetical protein [Paenibacillus]EFU41630.1 hypothetical protein PVOR_11830 [Paenibacillus vortex V453]MDH6672787.1 hypothetical protein [Paenibacillus sp. LBL]